MVYRHVSALLSKRVADIMATKIGKAALEAPNLPKILYQSENLLCVSKGYDIKINSDDRDEITTESQLRRLVPELVDDTCKHGFRYVNRLDYATSGILCLALNKQGAKAMWKQFTQRRVTKYYLALVRGHVTQDVIYIDIATGDLDDVDWPRRRCTLDDPRCLRPQETQTLLVCLERGTYLDKPATKVLLKPYTGRTHQLRVHCDHIGHTIVGDYTYSLRADTEPDRMMLHSHRFFADTGHDKIDIACPDPFTPDLDAKWCPSELCNTFEHAVEKVERFDPDEQTENVYSADKT